MIDSIKTSVGHDYTDTYQGLRVGGCTLRVRPGLGAIEVMTPLLAASDVSDLIVGLTHASTMLKEAA